MPITKSAYTESEACTRTGYELYELLFVSLFVRHFLACSRVQDTFKSSLYSKQVDQVKKVACRWSTINRYGLEARKTLVLTRG